MPKPPVATSEIFGQNFRYLLEKQGVTLTQFAIDLKIDYFRAKRWHSGTCFPQNSVLVRICQYFKYYNIYNLLTSNIGTK